MTYVEFQMKWDRGVPEVDFLDGRNTDGIEATSAEVGRNTEFRSFPEFRNSGSTSEVFGSDSEDGSNGTNGSNGSNGRRKFGSSSGSRSGSSSEYSFGSTEQNNIAFFLKKNYFCHKNTSKR